MVYDQFHEKYKRKRQKRTFFRQLSEPFDDHSFLCALLLIFILCICGIRENEKQPQSGHIPVSRLLLIASYS
ncbi:MAG: hypothetical protein LUC90_06335 [Lachnospiraceae bacterium]|nr:hypothetical protein [Lachnospiraceae bacterium]